MVEKYYSEHLADIYCGHAMEILKTLSSESVQMCMTSPPYWGLRNYSGGSDIVWGGDENCEHEWVEYKRPPGGGHPSNSAQVGSTKADIQRVFDGKASWCSLCGAWRGQFGLEPTPELYVEHLMMIFSEVKRVLRRDGSFYLNIGDTYASIGRSEIKESPGVGAKQARQKIARDIKWQAGGGSNFSWTLADGIQPKCMVCIPERVMFAMIDDGWILRNKIIWHKPNSMPSSVKDRFTTTWEYLYFFTKARRYYFDLDSVRIPHTTQSLERYQTPDDLFGHSPQPQSFNLRVRGVKKGKGGTTAQGGELRASEQVIEEYEYPEKQKHEDADLGAQKPARKRHSGYFGDDGQPLVDFAKGKNPGDTLTERQENIVGHFEQKGSGGHYLYGGLESPEGIHEHPKGKNPGDYWELTTQPYKGAHFAVYPEKLCERPIKASSKAGDVVLDMFSGAGTTGVVAKRLGRRAILIDCVESYCKIARDRISRVEYQPGLPTI